MRKPRDFDGELKALEDKARELKSRKVQQLGELVIAVGADTLSANELAGALIVLAETKDAGKREVWAKRGAAFFQGGAGFDPALRSAVLCAGDEQAVPMDSRGHVERVLYDHLDTISATEAKGRSEDWP